MPGLAASLVVVCACAPPRPPTNDAATPNDAAPNDGATRAERLSFTSSVGASSYVTIETAEDRIDVRGGSVVDLGTPGAPVLVETWDELSMRTSDGSVRGRRRLRFTFGQLQLHRELAVAAPDTLRVSRRGHTALVPVPVVGGAWLPEFWPSAHPQAALIVPSAATCVLLERLRRSGRRAVRIHGDALDAVTEVNVAEALVIGDVRCVFEGDRLVAIQAPTLGGTLEPGEAPVVVEPADFPREPEQRPRVDCPLPPDTRTQRFVVRASDGAMLAGQLDLPAGSPARVVVFASGTGGASRDGTYFGVPQWRCLAAGLLSNGLGVARFDDPGFGESPGSLRTSSYADRDAHVIAVARHAHERTNVPLILLGHSEGTNHVCRATPALGGLVDALVLVAGSGVDGVSSLLEQRAAPLRRARFPEALVEASVEQTRRSIAMVRGGGSAGIGGFSRTYWEEFFASDGSAELRAAAKPVLIVQGESDWQVPLANARRLEEAARSAGVAAETLLLPRAGHFLVSANSDNDGVGDEYGVPQPWPDEVVQRIATWARRR